MIKFSLPIIKQGFWMVQTIQIVRRGKITQQFIFFILICFPLQASQMVMLDGSTMAEQFDGIGAVSGGGATSVLLKDYPEPQRGQILDLLFKPNFGASMSALFVEVPGDGNSTQGSELSHMHRRDDLNCNRGYEWWLMREAKQRNTHLSLDGVAWGCPGWVGSNQFWSQDMCDYYVKWIQGLKSEHGLNLDALGCRNEKGVDEGFIKRLRDTLNQNGLRAVKLHGFDNWGKSKWDWCTNLESDTDLRERVDILSNHTMSEVAAPESVIRLSKRLSKPIWNTEEHVYKKGVDCELGLVHAFNDNYITSHATKLVCWYLISSFYPTEPYYDVTVMTASSPWSGHYQVNPALWAYAHYGQFCQIGWRYLTSGCGLLPEGGSYVAMASSHDYSVIVETKDARSNQDLTFQVGGGLSTGKLCVWRSNQAEQFIRRDDLLPVEGKFTLTLEPDSIYSISTTSGQQKGSFEKIPAEQPFPFPYHETFTHYPNARACGYLPCYTADISGGFELSDRTDGKGKCLRQVISQKAQSWAPEWMPYTVIGDGHWKDYEVSADIYFDGGGWAGVLGRVSSTGGGYGCNPKGYYLAVQTNGQCALWAATQIKNGSPGNQLATNQINGFDATAWHEVKLQFSGSTINGYVDKRQILSIQDNTYSEGMAGLLTGGENDRRNTAQFGNLIINRVNGPTPPPSTFARDDFPLYPH